MPHASHAAGFPAVQHTPPRLWRDVTIDTLRGIAIFIMVGANMGPLMEGPHPFAYRLFSTLAAPIFILVAGMMVSRSCVLHLAHRGLRHHLERGAFLVAVGALLDMAAWNILPFATVDVLYLIGVMLPVTYLMCRAPRWLPVAAMAAILIATPWLQRHMGYVPYPIEYGLDGAIRGGIDSAFLAEAMRHWLVDGWFPLFPWAGYMLLGILLARARWAGTGIRRFTAPKWPLLGFALMLLGGLCLAALPFPLLVRAGYGELFYPPNAAILLLTFGMTLLLFSAIDRSRGFVGWQLIRCLGESPLLMYIVHILLIGRVLEPVFGQVSPEIFAVLYGCFITWLLCMGWALRLTKKASPVPPRPVRWLLGGLEA